MTAAIAGAALVLIFWPIAWSNLPVVSEHAFTPLWLGYILTANGLSELVCADSLFKRLRSRFLVLFAASVPFWWFFEFVNSFVQNWHYVLPHPISDLEFNIRASICFSTVVPAVFSTTFLLRRILANRDLAPHWPAVRLRRYSLFFAMASGVVAFYLLIRFPEFAFPLVWIAPVLVVEPLLLALRYPCLLSQVERGRWLDPLSIALATTLTGFFWEFWNFYSMPKWVYTVPYVGFWKIFEMPLLGYLGYPFFGLAIYGYTMFVMSVMCGKDAADDLLSPIEQTSPA